jgi:hypothetical protein
MTPGRAAACALLAAACARSPAPPAPSAPVDERTRLGEAARAVLDTHCGACHHRHLATALPGALAVYDLDEAEWPARMSDAQLDSAVWRLGEPLPPDGGPNVVTADERARFAAWVRAERAARRAAPACPTDELVEAIHAAAWRLEHQGQGGVCGELGRAMAQVRGPLDETTRRLLARLARAGTEDARAVAEQLRAELAAWPCLTDELHRRLHARL